MIIPTYNGAHKLPSILNAIAEQNVKPDEVLIVVDGSTDNTQEVLDQFRNCVFNLKAVYQENRGRAGVRNKGAKEAKGKLLIFFDDDMYPEPSCIEKHVSFHAEHKNSIVTGGIKENPQASKADLHQFRVYLSEKWTNTLKQSSGTKLKKENLFLSAANFSIPRSLFWKIGGFDEQLNDAEDFDLAVRAWKASIPLYYYHEAFSWHNDIVTGEGYIRRLRQYHKAQYILRDLKPELFADMSKYFVNMPDGFKKKVFKFFSNKYWIKQLDNNSWLQKVPVGLRYKIYDIIVTSNSVFFPNRVQII